MINDIEYWENRFKSGDWNTFSGKEQTQFFYKIAIDNMPEWIKNQINKYNLAICDLGCAEGSGTQLIHQKFPNSNIVGVDFSKSAIDIAKDSFPEVSFICSDIFSFNKNFDIIFSSNTLEHFKDPETVLRTILNLADKYLILLLPFQEKELHEEHFASFDYNSFPLIINNYNLVYYKEIDTKNILDTYWPGKQILIIYGNTKNIDIDKFTLEELNNQNFEEYIHEKEEKKYISNKLNEEMLKLENKVKGLVTEKNHLKSDITRKDGYIQKNELLLNGSLNHIQKINSELEVIASTKPYKFAYVIRRFTYDFIKGENKDRKTFIRWSTSKLSNNGDNIQPISSHNLLAQLMKSNKNQITHIESEKQYSHYNETDYKKIFDEVFYQNDYKFINLFVLKCGWNMNLFQRPQHISLNFKDSGGLVLFRGAFNGVDNEMNSPIHKLENNLYLIDMDDTVFFNYILKKLENVNKPKVLHLYSTDNFISLDEIKKYENLGFKILYEYVDEISSDISRIEIPDETFKKHEYILDNPNFMW